MKPLAVTFGDATGIGPEIVVKTFADSAFMREHPAFVVGDMRVIRRAATLWAPSLRVEAIAGPEQHTPAPGTFADW